MPNVIMGTIEDEFIKNEDVVYVDGLLYYGKEGKLTDTYYIKHPVLMEDGKVQNKVGRVYVQGHVREGDLLCTCPLFGTAIKTEHIDCAFAKVVFPSVRNAMKGWETLEVCIAEFL